MKKEKIQKILEASYLNQNEAKDKLQDLGYRYDPELSSNDNKVFIDKNGNPNIVFRGTHKYRVKDLVSDAALALGLQKYNNRFKEAQHVTKLVEDKYHKPVDLYGHSLGGRLAEYVNNDKVGNIVTLNKGTGIFDIGKSIPKNQLDIRTTKDPFSALSMTQQHKFGNYHEIPSPLTQGLLEAHSIKNLSA
jgi:hypothetical protein